MIDTHTHIYGPEFDLPGQPEGSFQGQIETARRAIAAGVDHMMLANVDAASIAPIRALARALPSNIWTSIGLHPTELGDNPAATLDMMEALLNAEPFDAVGEIGIDLHWDASHPEVQMQVFARQLEWARVAGLPVLIHSRDALPQTLEVLRDFPEARAVFHSFGGSQADVERIRAVGDYYFGINGIVTFKNSNLRDTLPAIGMDRLLTETDAPYLSPAPYRGRRNESAMIPYIIGTMAQAMGVDSDTMAAATVRNTFNFVKGEGR